MTPFLSSFLSGHFSDRFAFVTEKSRFGPPHCGQSACTALAAGAVATIPADHTNRFSILDAFAFFILKPLFASAQRLPVGKRSTPNEKPAPDNPSARCRGMKFGVLFKPRRQLSTIAACIVSSYDYNHTPSRLEVVPQASCLHHDRGSCRLEACVTNDLDAIVLFYIQFLRSLTCVPV